MRLKDFGHSDALSGPGPGQERLAGGPCKVTTPRLSVEGSGQRLGTYLGGHGSGCETTRVMFRL